MTAISRQRRREGYGTGGGSIPGYPDAAAGIGWLG